MNCPTKLNFKTFLKIVSSLILQCKKRDLEKLEIAILEGVCQGQTYKEIAKDKNYGDRYLQEVGLKLWRDLSEALGEEVNKSNVRLTIEQKWHRDTQLNLSRCQIQLKDCFIYFLFVTRNTYAESVGNIDSSYNLLFKDSANKLLQKPCGVGNEKLTPKNRQAVGQLKSEPDAKLTAEIVVQVINSFIYLCTGKNLTYLEKKVAYGVWNRKNYDDIANKIKRSHCKNRELCGSTCECKYSSDYIRKNIASDLWSKLSNAFVFLDYEINKDNFQPTLEEWHENMKSSFTYSYQYYKKHV